MIFPLFLDLEKSSEFNLLMDQELWIKVRESLPSSVYSVLTHIWRVKK